MERTCLDKSNKELQEEISRRAEEFQKKETKLTEFLDFHKYHELLQHKFKIGADFYRCPYFVEFVDLTRCQSFSIAINHMECQPLVVALTRCLLFIVVANLIRCQSFNIVANPT